MYIIIALNYAFAASFFFFAFHFVGEKFVPSTFRHWATPLEYLFLEWECFLTKYVSSCPNTKYLYERLQFLKNEGVSNSTGESAF